MGYYADLIKEKKEKKNSKEEKDNDKVVEKYSKHGATIEIIQTESGKYRYRITKNGKGHETFTVETTVSAAKREAEDDAKNLQNEKEEKGYYAKLAEEKNSNPYYIALSLIKDKHSVNDMVREITSNYGVSKSEALHAIEKAAKDSHEAEIEKKARELY